MVAAGVHDLVMAGGTERTAIMGTPLATKTFAMGGQAEYESYSGITFPGVFAMVAHQYAHKYGLDLPELKQCMANVAVKNHRNGSLNPLAHFQKEITVDKVLGGVMIADPLQLLDCCPFSDGAAALVVADAAKFKHLVPKPVYVAGTGQGSAGALYRQKDITRILAREASVAHAYKEAGIGPRDVDVCELHDCFTIAEIIASEALGFFEFGQGAAAAKRGETALTGRIPINPSGGLKSKGHPIGATGAAQCYEIVKQLREEAGPRQVGRRQNRAGGHPGRRLQHCGQPGFKEELNEKLSSQLQPIQGWFKGKQALGSQMSGLPGRGCAPQRCLPRVRQFEHGSQGNPRPGRCQNFYHNQGRTNRILPHRTW